MQENDQIRLKHMLDSAKDAVGFISKRKREDLDNDRMLLLSIVKSIEIIGEAANKVSEECRKQFTGIKWLDIIGMRNRLIHAYYNVNRDVVWKTVNVELPDLIKELIKIVKNE